MKKFVSNITENMSAFDTTIACKIRADIKNGLTNAAILAKHPGFEELVNYYWERS